MFGFAKPARKISFYSVCAMVVGGGAKGYYKNNFCFSSTQTLNPTGNYFNFGVAVLPHPEKVYKGGEDAFYASPKVLAVADGVGGWAEAGIDPALYSKELCKNIGINVETRLKEFQKNPKSLIVDSAGKTKSIGSSTCCVVSLDEEKPVLYSSYIGDSGYIILRLIENNHLKEIFVFKEQTQGFNFPFQIGTNGNSPQQALKFEHEIQNNDIVILGTDGLFDNMDSSQIIKIIEPKLKEKDADLTKICQELGEYTKKLSLDEKYKSPFARRALESGYYFLGGKSDDITIIIGQIVLKTKV